MLNSVAEFFEEDVQTALTAALSLIEPIILIVMGVVVCNHSDRAVPADLFAGAGGARWGADDVMTDSTRLTIEGVPLYG